MPHPSLRESWVLEVANGRLHLPDEMERPSFTSFHPSDGAGYETALRQASEFLRRNADRRYSARTLQDLLTAADYAESIRVNNIGGTPYELPVILNAEAPFSYDEETEVKTGGPLGTAVLLPQSDNKLLVATHRDRRRLGVAGCLVMAFRELLGGSMTTWVAPTNTVGQHFLLALGFTPQAMNRAGAVCYGTGQPTEDGQDRYDPEDPYTLRARSARRRRQPRTRNAWQFAEPDVEEDRDPDF